MFVVILFVCLFSFFGIGLTSSSGRFGRGKDGEKGKEAHTVVFINWFVLLMLGANRSSSDPMESTEEMTITTKTWTTTIEIEEMWSARATFELCRFQREEMTSMFFLLFVVASAFIHLFRHHQTNHRVGPINRVKQKKRETEEFCATQTSLCSFFPFFFFFSLCWRSRGTPEQFGRPAVFNARVDGYFSFFFFFPFFFFLHKENTRMENRSCKAHTVYIL
jgi:hypothetical protein